MRGQAFIKANGHFEKGLYRTTWNAQACVEYFPMRNSELLIFAHLLYKGHHLTRRAQALGSTSPDTQRISVGLVYSIPVFLMFLIISSLRSVLIFHMGEATASPM